MPIPVVRRARAGARADHSPERLPRGRLGRPPGPGEALPRAAGRRQGPDHGDARRLDRPRPRADHRAGPREASARPRRHRGAAAQGRGPGRRLPARRGQGRRRVPAGYDRGELRLRGSREAPAAAQGRRHPRAHRPHRHRPHRRGAGAGLQGQLQGGRRQGDAGARQAAAAALPARGPRDLGPGPGRRALPASRGHLPARAEGPAAQGAGRGPGTAGPAPARPARRRGLRGGARRRPRPRRGDHRRDPLGRGGPRPARRQVPRLLPLPADLPARAGAARGGAGRGPGRGASDGAP